MKPIIYLPLEHLEQRYTRHLDRDILNYLNSNSIKYKYIEPKVLNDKINNGSFLDADNTIYRQFYQFQKLIEGLISKEIPAGSNLFITDIWNFGILAVPYLNYFSNHGIKVSGVLHAGSFTDTDFVREMERYYKNFEDIIFDICDKIYVGSHFIKNDIIKKRVINKDKIIVTGLPLDFNELNKIKVHKKDNLIVFNGRNVDEKQPYLFELLKEKLPEYEYINTQKLNLSKDEYYKVLARAKVVVSFALQENFGYGIQEAVALKCIPVLPNRLAYVEQFKTKYLYNSFEECINKIRLAMEDKIMPPELKYNNNNKIFKKWFSNDN